MPQTLIGDTGERMRKGIITFFVLALIVLYVIIYVVPSVTGMLDSTYVVEYGVLSIHDDTTAYLIRNERVYQAASSGAVNRLAEEGDLLRGWTPVIDIHQGAIATPTQRLNEIKKSLEYGMVTGHGNVTQSGGIVSYYVDGYENFFLPDSIMNYRKSDFNDVTQDKVVALGMSTNEGYPVFKLIDTTKWYIIAYVPLNKEENYPIGRTVNVIFTKSSTTVEEEDVEIAEEDESDEIDESETYGSVEMDVLAAEEEGGELRLVVETSRYFAGLGELRVADCRIISASVRGLLVENESIIEEEGKEGVYVKTKTGRYEFVPIDILGSNDKTTVVSDMYYYDEEGTWTKTIDPFDDILKDPSKREKGDEESEETNEPKEDDQEGNG